MSQIMSPLPVCTTKHCLLLLLTLAILVSALVWRAEVMTFSANNSNSEHPPSIQLVPPSDSNDNTVHEEDNFLISRHSDPISHSASTTKLTEESNSFGIDTAPYDLSRLHIYGEEEYCDESKWPNLKYMDVNGMYDTGTNTFYMTLTKNCWGIETRSIDYITGYPPDGADESEKVAFRARAQELYELERPNVLGNVSMFRNVKWKPRMGKHHAISSEWDFEDPEWRDMVSDIRQRLSLVIIKDPLTWFKSLCKASYEVKWMNRPYKTRGCPFGLNRNNGTFSANMWHSVHFRSIMQLWNWWYGSWTNSGQTVSGNYQQILQHWNSSDLSKHSTNWKQWMKEVFFPSGQDTMVHDVPEGMDHDKFYRSAIDIPHLVVRYEDILFQPEKLINRLCQCVKGYLRPGGVIIQESAAKAHGAARGRVKALQTYGNPEYRLEGYPEEDIQLMRRTLNHTLLSLFSYDF